MCTRDKKPTFYYGGHICVTLTLEKKKTYIQQRHRTNSVLMLGHRLRRWPNIKTVLVQRLVFAEEPDQIHTITASYNMWTYWHRHGRSCEGGHLYSARRVCPRSANRKPRELWVHRCNVWHSMIVLVLQVSHICHIPAKIKTLLVISFIQHFFLEG